MAFRLLEFMFTTLTILTVTIIFTGQNALGTSASNIFNPGLTGNDDLEKTSLLKGMNFSKTAEVHSQKGILEATVIIDEHEGMVGNEPVKAITYNGSLNGPTLHIKPGERMIMYYVNNLNQPTNVHFHGLHVSPLGSSDNIFRVIGPGETAKYVLDIPIDHERGTFWYHSHLHGLSTDQVGGGLSGLLVIEGLEDLLPDTLRKITQKTFTLRGFPWHFWHLNYTFPTYQTVNGEVNPVVSISPGETQRWRFANIDPGTFYNITLPGHTFRVIEEDGNPVWEAWDTKYLVIPAGKRFSVLVTGGESGSYPLKMLSYEGGVTHAYPEITLATINVQGNYRAEIAKVNALSLEPKHDLGSFGVGEVRELVFSASESNTTVNRFGEQGTNLIDGKVFDHNRVDQTVKLGDIEEWHIKNIDDDDHTFHIHVNDYQVMSVNNIPYEAHGLQDTVILPGNGEVVIRMQFEDFVGKFVYHCHILPHEDTGMMGIVEVVDPLTPSSH